MKPDSKSTMGEFLKVCPKRVCISTVGTRTDLFQRDPNKVPITDFFGSVRKVEVSTNFVNLSTSVSREDNVETGELDRDPQSKEETFHFVDQFPLDTLLKP